MHYARIAVTCVALALTACASSGPALTDGPYDARTQARVRFYGANGISLKFYPNAVCIPNGGGIRVSGGMGQAFGSMVGAKSNDSIGMPSTAYSANPRSGILAKGYFSEFAVIAGQPLSVAASFMSVPASSGIWLGCGTIGVNFVPQAGQDYEVELSPGTTRCTLRVSRLLPHTEGGIADVSPESVAAVSSCPSE